MAVRSLEGRLHLGLGLSLIALVLCVWWLGHTALHRVAESFVLSRLQHDAEALLGAMHIKGNGTLGIGKRRLTPVYNQPYSGHYYAMQVENGPVLVSRSLWDRTLELPEIPVGATRKWRIDGPVGQRLLVWGGAYRRDGHNFSLFVAEDVKPLEQELTEFEWLLAAVAGLGIVVMAVIQRTIVHRGFRQLRPVYRDIERLERGEALGLTEAVPSEVKPLVRKLNRLLDLYRHRLERSRNAAGNLAHALKTPLNLLMQRLKHGDPPVDPAVQATLREQITRIRQLMERELKRARLSGAAAVGLQFNPADELPVMIQLLEQMYPDKQLEITLGIDADQRLMADREDMLEMLGNLLDNACKWARQRVHCRVSGVNGGTRFTIEDDGPGCSDEELERITARGVRLDESVSGHGLGLSITKDIVDIYQGHVAFDRSPDLGGLRATVRLPASSQSMG
jgi:signal transduction histidine kinase